MKVIIFVTIIGTICAFVLIAERDRKTWEEFARINECVVVSYEKSSTSSVFGLGTNGQVGSAVVTTPSKTSWKCNDGVTYVR